MPYSIIRRKDRSHTGWTLVRSRVSALGRTVNPATIPRLAIAAKLAMPSVLLIRNVTSCLSGSDDPDQTESKSLTRARRSWSRSSLLLADNHYFLVIYGRTSLMEITDHARVRKQDGELMHLDLGMILILYSTKPRLLSDHGRRC